MPRHGPFLAFAQVFSALIVQKKLPERAPTKKQLRVLSIIDQLRVWAHRRSAYAQLSPLPFSLPLRHSCDKLFQALSCFSVLKVTESWVGLGNEASVTIHHMKLCRLALHGG